MPMHTMIHRTRIIIIITYLRGLVKLNSQHVQQQKSELGLGPPTLFRVFLGFFDFFELDKILISDGIYTARRDKTALSCTNFKLKLNQVLQQYRLIKCTLSSQNNGAPKTYRFPSLANIDTKMSDICCAGSKNEMNRALGHLCAHIG